MLFLWKKFPFYLIENKNNINYCFALGFFSLLRSLNKGHVFIVLAQKYMKVLPLLTAYQHTVINEIPSWGKRLYED